MALLHEQITNAIISYIESIKTPQAKLPTEREFSYMFGVSRQTIRKALATCEEKGIIEKRQGSGIYLTSAYLRKINHIAIIVPFSDEYIYPRLIHELEYRFNTISYSLDVYETRNLLYEEKNILNNLINHPVSVLLVVIDKNLLPSPFSDTYRLIAQKGTKIIFIGNPNPNLTDYSYVKFDDFYSGYSVAKRVSNKENNWCAIFVNDNRGSMDRYYGFIQCMQDNDYSYNETNIKWVSTDDIIQIRHNNDTSIIRRILNSYMSLPTILICGNDEIAYSTIMHLKNTKQLTDDIRIFTFDNSLINSSLNMSLYSYNGDKSMFYSKIIEMVLSTKKEKEVLTLPSTLNT